jgi:K+-sensing histidine kinase KdpD
MEVIKHEDMNKINNELLSAVSHELRTPLAAIKGYSTMLLDYLPKLTAEETKEYIQSIDNATDRMTQLVNDLLDTSRLEEGRLNLEKTQVDIEALIKATAKEAETRNKRHEILIAQDSNLPRVNIDPGRIRKVLDNLIDNAAKLSPQEREILISVTADDKEIGISVISHDPGIPDCEFCSISELMYRMGKSTLIRNNGMNLELYICQRLIEAHGGRIWAKSIVGKGTTIKFILPID